MKIITKNSLYIRGLLWAYEKRNIGFTKDQMKSELNISDEEWPWVHWMFFNGLNGDSPLMWIISGEFQGSGETDHSRLYLTASGTAAVIDYLELKEAQEGGKRATKIAFASIFISIIVGLFQIYFDINADKYSSKPEPTPIQQPLSKG